jgi:hypothetical protein
VVIDFSVEDDPNITIFIGQRLVTTLDVYDTQSAHGQTDILFDEESLIVRPAMGDAPVHAGQHVTPDMPVAIGKEYPADSTHG